MRYAVYLYDAADRVVAAITPIEPEYRRRANQATGFSFGVLANDNMVQKLEATKHCVLYRDGVEKVSGYITARDFSTNPYRIECITNEALLRRNIVPREWKGWENYDLADAVRDICLGFRVETKNAYQDWLSAVDSSNVDIETEPGKVLLAKDELGAYKPQGYITVQFDMGNVVRNELLRWAEDVGEAVRIKVQFRTSADGIVWGGWSTELESVAPDEDGVALTGSDRYMQVRFNLYTNDTTTKDNNGVRTGFTPLLSGAEVVARVPGPVEAGVIPSTLGINVQGYVFNRENALRILQTWCEDYDCEFYVDSQKELHFDVQLGRNTSVILRRTTTMNVQSLSDNADGIQNVVTCLGAGEGAAQLSVVLRDDESIAAYDGEFPGVYENTDCRTVEELTAAGQKYLAANAWPKEEFKVTDVPVWEMEEFGLYDTVTVVDPLREVVTSARVLDEERKLDRSGEKVTLGLNTTLDNVIERITKQQISKPTKLPVPSAEPYHLTAVPGIMSLYLRWSGQADYWVIEHSLDGEVWGVLEPRWGSTRYSHDGLEAGPTHYYRVRGSRNGKLSNPTEPVYAIPLDVLPPDFGLDDLYDYNNVLSMPTAPVGLSAFRAFKAFALTWEMATPPPRIDRYEVQYATSPDGVTWGTWIACSVGERSANYTHQGLDAKLHYKYRVRAVSLAGVEGPWSNELVAGLPGKASLSEDVVDQLARERLSLNVQSELDGLDQGLTDAKGRLTSAEERLTTAETSITDTKSRLTSAEGRLGSAETAITDAANRLSGAEDRLVSAETAILGAEGRLTTAETAITDAKGRLTNAESRLTTAETSITTLDDEITLKASSSDLNTLTSRVSTNEATLTTHAQEIATRVTQTVFDVLKGRVTTAEGTLTTHADEIATRVKQTVFDTLEGRVTDAEGTLAVHANDIAARVTKTVFDALESRVADAEGTLTVQADEIATRVKQTVFDTLENRVADVEGTLTVQAGQIEAKASQTDFNALAGRVTTAEGTLTTQAGQIAAKASKTELDTLEGRVTEAEGTLTVQASEIAAKAAKTDHDALAERVTSAESTLTVQAGEIAAKASKTDHNALAQRVTTAEGTLTAHADAIAARVTKTVHDALAQRVTDAEGTLVVHADDIAARVTKTVFDALESRMTDAEGVLTVHADEIAARVTNTDHNLLAQRVTTAEGTLLTHADEIQARVKQTVYDVLAGRVGIAETTLTQHADAIGLRVTQEVFDLLKNRVGTAETTLDLHADQIQQTVTRLEYASRIAGTISAVGVDTLTDTTKAYDAIIVDGKPLDLVGMVVRVEVVKDGKTYGVMRSIKGYTSTVLTLDSPWDAEYTPTVGSSYQIGTMAVISGTQIDQTNDTIKAIATKAEDGANFAAEFTLSPMEISSTVAKVMPDGELYTTIQQNADDIAQRVVHKGEVISEINQSVEGVRIAGKKIQLDGDTEVTGDFRIDGDLLLGGSVKHTAIDIGAPDSLAGIGISFGTDKLYQDAFGNWYVRVTLNLTGIPSDSKRAYIQIKYRRAGSTSYHLGDQIPLAYGNASVTVDGLTPDAEYEYSIVPSNHFGVEGVGKTVSRVTSKDETPPAQPIGVTARPILGGIAVDHGTTPPESDWDYDEVEVFGKQAVVGEGVAAGWQAFSGPYLVSKFDMTDQNVYSGNLAQRIQITDWIDPGAYDDVRLYQECPASEGQTWQASAWVMSDMPNVECLLTMQFRDANGNTLDGSDGYGYAEATYQNVLGSEMTAPSGTAKVFIEITFVMMGGTGNIYIDAASAIADGVEQLQNPDFEGSWTSQAIYKRRALHTEIADGLVPGNSYRARVRRVNTGGNISPWSDEVEAIAGRANTDGIEDGSVTTKKIEARAVTEADVIQVVDSSGASTTSDTLTDIPGFSISFALDEPTACLIYMNLDGKSEAFGDSGTASYFALKIDGSVAECSKRAIDVYVGEESHWTAVSSSIAVMTLQELSAGQHTIKGVFNAIDFSTSSSQTYVCDRVLGVIALKR